ncbi:MAG: DUF3311 domain-containing protein [Bryobacteraceae bacterium]
MKAALVLLVALFYLLHQDFWFWSARGPLLFGLLPPGLWYHALYTIGCSLLLALLVKVSWPASRDGEER